MKNFIETYRGTDIYESNSISKKEGKELGKRLTSHAVVPGLSHLHTEFIEEADTMSTAMEKMHKAIDRYLLDHELNHFSSPKN